MTLRDLLASSRLLRLARAAVEETRQAQQDALDEERWQREARERLSQYGG